MGRLVGCLELGINLRVHAGTVFRSKCWFRCVNLTDACPDRVARRGYINSFQPFCAGLTHLLNGLLYDLLFLGGRRIHRLTLLWEGRLDNLK